MPKFMVVIREFKEYEYVENWEDAEQARTWAEELMQLEGCDLEGYEIRVRRLYQE